MNGLALCAGIGGLELGIHLAVPGYRTICFVEREAHAAAILVRRMEEGILAPAPIWDDLATFDAAEWCGLVDILSAGYPCQPFSIAGGRRGTSDPRHLWPHVARIISGCKPTNVFLENVPGHLYIGFDRVCEELAGMGYRVAAGLFSAAEVGAPHLRRRLFAMGYPDGAGSQGWSVEPGECPGEQPAWPPGIDGDWAGVDPALYPRRVPESKVHRVADGLAPRVDRLRACGNGVVPLVAAHAFRTLSAELA